MTIKIALIQLRVVESKDKNLKNAVDLIRIAKKEKEANVVVLPECFNAPYTVDSLAAVAEPVPDGETCRALAKAATDYGVYVVGGSIVESLGGQLYNTCTVWGPEGDLLATYRKVHLCDSSLSGKTTVPETKLFTAGSQFATFTVAETRIGLGICWDMRFPEFAAAYRALGCDLLIYPAVCDVPTGELHWELLAKARALDNQTFVAFCSPARDTHAKLIPYGHSLVVDPWGSVLQRATEFQEIVVADLVLKELTMVRHRIPVFDQKRADMYELKVRSS
ncbi:omega-amidase NIT2-like [Anopheles cruzii]|uniref:omega-amidase NIT2-like n=1 Tax=Anopheles cruzii TaxID=68878 RepID=UPI0022EC8A14|nr:omega-amidase NIT2-like [Anopheles cruzii]